MKKKESSSISNGLVDRPPSANQAQVIDGSSHTNHSAAVTAIVSPHRSLTSSAEGVATGVAGTEYSSSLDKLNSSLTELQGEIMKLSLKRGTNNG